MRRNVQFGVLSGIFHHSLEAQSMIAPKQYVTTTMIIQLDWVTATNWKCLATPIKSQKVAK